MTKNFFMLVVFFVGFNCFAAELDLKKGDYVQTPHFKATVETVDGEKVSVLATDGSNVFATYNRNQLKKIEDSPKAEESRNEAPKVEEKHETAPRETCGRSSLRRIGGECGPVGHYVM